MTETLPFNQSAQASQALQDQIRAVTSQANAALNNILQPKTPEHQKPTVKTVHQNEDEAIANVQQALNPSANKPTKNTTKQPDTLYAHPYLTTPTQFASIGPPPRTALKSLSVQQYLSNASYQNPIAPDIAAQYQSIPGYIKSNPLRKYSALFNTSPLSPPPFPTSAMKEAQKALGKK